MTVRNRFMLTTVLVLGLGGLLALLPLGARTLEPREVVIIARQMSFYSGDGATANPTIQVSPGERVRITLVGADPGVDHDFAVTAWGVQTALVRGVGRTSIVIQAPDTPGEFTYLCSLHASMMTGSIQVSARPTAAPPAR